MEKKILASKFFNKKKHIRNSRSSETYLKTRKDKEGRTVIDLFHNKPQYEGHAPSTHFVGEAGRYAYPTITEKKDGTGYKNQSFDEALEAGEVYRFLSKKRAEKFAHGSWKQGRDRKEAMKGYREYNKENKKK